MRPLLLALLVCGNPWLAFSQSEPNESETSCEIAEIITLGTQDIESLKGEAHKKGSLDGDTYWIATKKLEGVSGEVHYSELTIPSQHYVQYVVNPDVEEVMAEFEVEMLAAGYLACLGDEYEEDKIDGDDHYTVTVKRKADSAFFHKLPHIDIKSEKWGDQFRVVVTVRFPDQK